MRAHLIDEDGWIINTVLVPDLNFIPGLVDAAIGGQIGDRIVDGVLIYVVTKDPNAPEPEPEDPPVDPEPEPDEPEAPPVDPEPLPTP